LEFEVSRSGEGLGFDDHPILPMNLDDIVAKGQRVLQYFRNKLTVKKVVIVQRKEKMLLEKEEDMGFQIANEHMQEILDKAANDETMLFVAFEVTGLRAGFQYRFRVRGVNKAGPGPWSLASYSINTLPTLPEIPTAPHVEEKTLTSIKFAWYAPDGNGTAIVGYRINIQHTGKEINLPRSQQSSQTSPRPCARTRTGRRTAHARTAAPGVGDRGGAAAQPHRPPATQRRLAAR
jgi:hypothetical protein